MRTHGVIMFLGMALPLPTLGRRKQKDLNSTRTAAIAMLASILVGCSKSETQQTQTGEPSSIVMRMMDILSNYQLPKQSILAQTNPDPQIDKVIQRMQQAAANQKLTFDGSLVADGIVIVGKQGQSAQMVLVISVYTKDNRIAIHDVYNFNGLDFDEGTQMRTEFLQALRKPKN